LVKLFFSIEGGYHTSQTLRLRLKARFARNNTHVYHTGRSGIFSAIPRYAFSVIPNVVRNLLMRRPFGLRLRVTERYT